MRGDATTAEKPRLDIARIAVVAKIMTRIDKKTRPQKRRSAKDFFCAKRQAMAANRMLMKAVASAHIENRSPKPSSEDLGIGVSPPIAKISNKPKKQ